MFLSSTEKKGEKRRDQRVEKRCTGYYLEGMFNGIENKNSEITGLTK